MLAPVLLLVTYSTFGPIAQDDSSLYIVDHGRVVRVDKNDPAKRTTLTTPTTRRIASMDVDGGRVLYGTAPAPECKAVPPFPPATTYVYYVCSLVDTNPDHEIRSVPIFGGKEDLWIDAPQGATETTHDDEWIYWLLPSSGLAPAGAVINRRNKMTGKLDRVAEALIVSAVNQHPFALSDDSVYFVNNNRLQRVAKSGGSITDIASVNRDSSIAISGAVLHFVDHGDIYSLDTRSGAILGLRVPLPSTSGATLAIGILGNAPGLILASIGSGWTATAFRGWSVSDLCAQTATVLGSILSSRYNGYFIAPLAEPPIAVDSTGIYIGDRRVSTFATPPVGCPRRRVIPH